MRCGDTKFARKIIRLMDRTVVQREVHAITNLVGQRCHKNIVTILKHGKFPPEHYYIDMELCHFDLQNFIYQPSSKSVASKIPHFKDDGLPSRIKDDVLRHILEDIAC